MKKVIYFSLILFAVTAGCKKDSLTLRTATIPFESNDIKLTFAGASMPAGIIVDIFFINSSTGFAITYEGGIYKTNDAGTTWNLEYTNTVANQPFYKVLFTSENVGYVVGGSTGCTGGANCVPPGGLILKTTDGGSSWTKVFQMPDMEFVSIASNTQGDLFVLANGTKSSIFRSTDEGSNWSSVYTTDFGLLKITFYNNLGFCIGMYGNILCSINDGGGWSLNKTITALYGTDIKSNGEIGLCIVNNGIVYKTNDDGIIWEQNLNSDGSFVINFTANSILLFGAGRYSGGDWGTWDGAVRQTKNSGTDWSEVELTNIEPIRYTSFYSATEGYTVAGNKLIRVTVK